MFQTSTILALSLALATACGDKDSGDTGAAAGTDDTGSPSTGHDTGSSSDGGDDTGSVSDAAPTITLARPYVGGAVGEAVTFEVEIDDEDPDGCEIVWAIDDALVSGGFDGLAFTGAADAAGSTTATLTVTDAGGRSNSIEIPVETWVPRTWTGFVTLASENDELPGPDIGVSPEGWTYVAGHSGGDGFLTAADPDGLAWSHAWTEETEYGRSAAWEASTDTAIYVAEAYPASRGLIRSVDEDGIVWEAEAPWESTTTYWVDAEDGLVLQTGTFGDHAYGAGAWASFVDPADGSAVGDPIVIGADDEDRIVPMSADIMADGRALIAAWGYHDIETGETSEQRQSWVQVAEAGDEEPAPLVTYAVDDALVEITHALELRDGDIVALGYAQGELFGPLVGIQNGFIEVLTPDGDSVWNLQAGTEGRFLRAAQGHDGTLYVVADAGADGASLALYCFDPADGTELCHTTISIDAGSGHTMMGRGIAFSGQDVIVDGYFLGTQAELGLASEGGYDAFVARFDTDGRLQ